MAPLSISFVCLSSALTIPVLHCVKSFALHSRYSSKEACSLGPIWSGSRLVNTPISNIIPAVLSSLSPCEDTSITTALQPASTIFLKVSCICIDSGVVLHEGIASSPMTVSIVPISPVFIPHAHSTFLIIYVVVVLPLVPVIPIVNNSLSGLP